MTTYTISEGLHPVIKQEVFDNLDDSNEHAYTSCKDEFSEDNYKLIKQDSAHFQFDTKTFADDSSIKCEETPVRGCQVTLHRLRVSLEDGTQKGNKTLACWDCPETFPLLPRVPRGAEVFQCDECWKVFSCRAILDKHLSVKHTLPACRLCGKVFSSLTGLRGHLRIHSTRYDSMKIVLGLKKSSEGEVHGRLRSSRLKFTVVQEKPKKKPLKEDDEAWKKYTCGKCKKRFMHSSGLKGHMLLLHSVSRQYRCDFCRTSFDRRRLVKRHMRRRHADQTKVCRHCSKKFIAKLAWTCHQRMCNAPRIHTCHHCGSRFSEKSVLTNHVLTHLTEKDFQCDICGRRFTRKCILRNHMHVHTGENGFTCQICTRTFARKATLKHHVLIHKNGKPFGCTFCYRMFSEKTKFLKHIVAHETLAFPCKICGRNFYSNHALQTHRMIHTGERPYACTKCDKRFNQPGALKNHINVLHSKLKPYPCPECGRAFTQKRNLEYHIMKMQCKKKPRDLQC